MKDTLIECTTGSENAMTIYTLYDNAGESQTVVCCGACANRMPNVDNERVYAKPADPDISCDFCVAEKVLGRKI